MKLRLCPLLFTLASLLGSIPHLSAKDEADARTALVVGVGNYRDQYFPSLSAPPSDAKAMEEKLKAMGFKVKLLLNPTRREMVDATDDFGTLLTKRQGVGLFYFSGHGSSKPDEADPNFLIPAGTKIASREDLPQEAFNAQRVANRMKEAGNRLNLIFLDACRNNALPSRRKDATGGLAAMRGASGLMFFFATQPNQIALEDSSTHRSLFTDALLRHIQAPGISFMDLMADVTADTEKLSSDGTFKQSPYISGTLSGRFVFVPSTMPERGSPAPPPSPKVEPALDAGKKGIVAGERLSVEIAPGVAMAFRWCPSGSFTMGPKPNENLKHREMESQLEENAHHVTLTKGFWMAETTVTQRQWEAVMKTSLVQQANKMLADETVYKHGPKKTGTLRAILNARKGDGQKHIGKVSGTITMYDVNWGEADDYCGKISREIARSLPGMVVRLPTEAEWEYACRAGTETMTYAGDFTILGDRNAPALDPIAWYGGNSSVGYDGAGWSTASWKEVQHAGGGMAGPREVGLKKPNAWGLCDMIGNVFQWCSDYSASYDKGSVTDPTGPTSGETRVNRGSCWANGAAACRSANRYKREPGYRSNYLGFRPALAPVK